jgi:hypothetical protein
VDVLLYTGIANNRKSDELSILMICTESAMSEESLPTRRTWERELAKLRGKMSRRWEKMGKLGWWAEEGARANIYQTIVAYNSIHTTLSETPFFFFFFFFHYSVRIVIIFPETRAESSGGLRRGQIPTAIGQSMAV